MDQALVFGYLLLACVVTLAPISPPSEVPPVPSLLGCLFHQRTNVTCNWEDGGHAGPPTATSYTLLVEKMRGRGNQSLIEAFNCTTAAASCTADLRGSNVVFFFCISVVACDSGGCPRSSLRRCRPGRDEMVLERVGLLSVDPVRARPDCLLLRWDRSMSYPLTEREINNGSVLSELEFFTQGQVAEREEVQVSAGNFKACLFSPGTSYSLRLRQRLNASLPWSPWSQSCHGNTAEAAPSAAPSFWRRVTQTHNNGWNNVSLLWKPLHADVARGQVLLYNVLCHRPDGPLLADLGSCDAPKPATATSCHLLSPPGTFFCSIAATNSAGSSPGADIWVLGDQRTGLPPPNQMAVKSLDDHRLGVRWTAPVNQSVKSFVVDWSEVTSSGRGVYHWEMLNASQEELVITDGLEPYALYVVSVTAVYAHGGTGEARETFVYTRQGVPSAGPVVVVQETVANGLQLAWLPVPVEQQRGHVRNYTIYYIRAQGPTMSRTLPGQVLEWYLGNLLPGSYTIHMLASTDAGPGVAGPPTTVTLEVSRGGIIVNYLTFILTAVLMLILAVLAHQATQRLRHYQHIPDASKSSVAHWTPSDHTQKIKWLPVVAHHQRSDITFVLEKACLENPGILCDPAYHRATQGPQRSALAALLGRPAGTSEPLTDYASVVFHQQDPAALALWNLLRQPQHPQTTLTSLQ